VSGFDWRWSFAFEVMPIVLAACKYTILLTVAGFSIAMVLGLVLTLLRAVRHPALRWPLGFFVEFVRGTPVLVQIFFIYFVLPEYGIVLPAMLTGILVLGLHYSTYVSEVYRGGLASVDRAQWEAASALNLGAGRTFFGIILPQALPPIVPALGNYLITLFKETPLLSAIAVTEMLQTAKDIGSETFRYTEPITIIGIIFLALSLASATAIRWVERHLKKRWGIVEAKF
jgi:polar amino acid transport system permease protein